MSGLQYEMRKCRACGKEHVRVEHGARQLEVACVCGAAPDFDIYPLVRGNANVLAALNVAIGALTAVAENKQEPTNVAARALGVIDAYVASQVIA